MVRRLPPEQVAFEARARELSPSDRLAVTAWVLRHLADQSEEGGSFRVLIYNRLGFPTDAYAPLYRAGGQALTNALEEGRKSS